MPHHSHTHPPYSGHHVPRRTNTPIQTSIAIVLPVACSRWQSIAIDRNVAWSTGYIIMRVVREASCRWKYSVFGVISMNTFFGYWHWQIKHLKISSGGTDVTNFNDTVKSAVKSSPRLVYCSRKHSAYLILPGETFLAHRLLMLQSMISH